ETGVHVGVATPADAVRRDFDAVLLACGALAPRDMQAPGRHLTGIHFAYDYLVQQNRVCAGLDAGPTRIDAAGKDVVIIGGGDTGADCFGTALRQGARSVRQLDLYPAPPGVRSPDNPWPEWPRIFRLGPAHAEGGERAFEVRTEAFEGDAHGAVQALSVVQVDVQGHGGSRRVTPRPGTAQHLPAQLVLLAVGFFGPEPDGLVRALGLPLTERGTAACDAEGRTVIPGVWATGDMTRGASLIVWAIADGRRAAASVDAALRGTARPHGCA
ncbi:MAG TPA: FAD-dependent oxidoreductase, partial [Myxococcota bacterium]|nr:FAD-dependent oxidoreductase [Myxococcota bacterium]